MEEEAFQAAAFNFMDQFLNKESETLKEYLAIPLNMPKDQICKLREEDFGYYFIWLLGWKNKIFQVFSPQIEYFTYFSTLEEAWTEALEQLDGKCYLVSPIKFEECIKGERPWEDVYPPQKQNV